jgi:hypothetical protein
MYGEAPRISFALWSASWARALMASTVAAAADVSILMNIVICVLSFRVELGLAGEVLEPTR